jgi:pimeloyl-ACP methyl ester carboxylesterase
MVAPPLPSDAALRSVVAGDLHVGYRDEGPATGPPVVLLHGFPYDLHAYEAVSPRLVAAGCRVITPFLRGFGTTAFRDPATPRSGQQAALAHDLLALMDALHLPAAVLGGYDWGGRAASIVAALWPDRVRGLVCDGYSLQDLAAAARPLPPEVEQRYWYQYYFHGERGRAGLMEHRRALTRLLWATWSPTWAFPPATFARTAAAFDNPDFVEVVIHAYRHRFGLVPGDPAYEATEARIAQQPPIAVPTLTLHGGADAVTPPPTAADPRFQGPYAWRVLPGVGHNLPQEAPEAFAEALLAVAGLEA